MTTAAAIKYRQLSSSTTTMMMMIVVTMVVVELSCMLSVPIGCKWNKRKTCFNIAAAAAVVVFIDVATVVNSRQEGRTVRTSSESIRQNCHRQCQLFQWTRQKTREASDRNSVQNVSKWQETPSKDKLWKLDDTAIRWKTEWSVWTRVRIYVWVNGREMRGRKVEMRNCGVCVS